MKWICMLAAMLLAAPGHAAEPYPQRVVTMVVPFGAGASIGTVAQMVAERLMSRLGQGFVVEYKPGGSGTVGTAFVAKSRPDGYTLLVSATGPMSIAPVVHKNLSYAPTDLVPIAQFTRVPFILVAGRGFQGRTVKDLMDQVKQNPGKYHFASTGNGTLVHLAAQMLLDEAGGVASHIPYTAAPQVATSLIREDVLFSVANISAVAGFFADGRIRPIAITSKARFAPLQDVPTVAESGYPDYDVGQYVGLFGPRGMPQAVVEKLNASINEVLREPAIDQALRRQGDLAAPAGVGEFTATVNADLEKWGTVARRMDLKNE